MKKLHRFYFIYFSVSFLLFFLIAFFLIVIEKKEQSPFSLAREARMEVEMTQLDVPECCYPSSYRGEIRVFMMPGKKELDILAIAASLHKKYSAVMDVFRVRTNRIRVIVNDRAQANAIAADPVYTENYRVYIPGSMVGWIRDLFHTSGKEHGGQTHVRLFHC